ncbi:MAG: hypothetical protein IH849_04130 [Acidobacteria bacterium]|nr:hypothetical protein [Acidobacteriota bacterium]
MKIAMIVSNVARLSLKICDSMRTSPSGWSGSTAQTCWRNAGTAASGSLLSSSGRS